MKLAICIPARDTVHTLFAHSLANLTAQLTKDKVDYEVKFVCGSVIVESRTQLVKQALESKATHILWLDTDINFPSTVFKRLSKHNKKIIAGQYSTRYAPYQNVAFTDPEDITKRLDANYGLHKIWAVGMGCMLVDISVFDQLPKPWFKHEYNENLDTFSGEDIYFCNQALEHNIDVYIDADVKLTHIGLKANIL